MHTTVRFRAYPNRAQQELWAQHAGACRVVFNLCLGLTLDMRRTRGVWVEDKVLYSQLQELRNDPDVAPWLQTTPAKVLQQAVRQHRAAWLNMGHGARRPQFRRKNTGRQTFTLPQNVRVKRTSKRWGEITMPGGGCQRLKVRWHRTPPGTIKSATYVREADGTYWVSLVCETRDRTPTVHLNDHGPIGVDLGVAVPVATSNGDQWGFTPLTVKEQQRLVRLQRKLARQPKQRTEDGRMVDGSNRARTKQQIAKLKARARRRRHAFAEQVSAHLTNNHGVVVFEQLPVAAMTRSAKGTLQHPGVNVRQKAGLNRAILDVGWAHLVERTKQKAARRGAVVRQVNPAYTSQTCPDCGTVDPAQRVTRSRYDCRACGYHGHADVGAARTILVRGTSHPPTGSGWQPVQDLQTPVGSMTQEQTNGHSTTQTDA